ncbi:chromosome replication initiation inhibitor protein [Vibrio cholerae]|nr:chromosome replication initiation inhibitor protein [Vibrio cholerae]
MQIISELESGALINMTPDFMLSYPIFWHHWQLETGVLLAPLRRRLADRLQHAKC